MPASDAYFWNIKKMHVVFAASSLVLLGVTLWMLAADHSREWMAHQKTMNQILLLKANAKRSELNTEEYKQAIKALKLKIADQVTALDSNADYETAVKEFEAADLKVVLIEADLKTQRAKLGVANANRDLAISRGEPKTDVEALGKKFDVQEIHVTKQAREAENLAAKRATAESKVKGFTNTLDGLRATLKERQKNIAAIEKQLFKIRPEGWFSRNKRSMMEWPIVQGFNSHLNIQQDWLPGLPHKLGMSTTGRVDRCRSCHLGIDQVGAGDVPSFPHGMADENTVEGWVKENKFPQPYSTHPNPKLFLTASSPHPTAVFGCTVCHDGNGSGTSFQDAEHGPNHPDQAVAWKKDHHYHPNHFWESPMLPKRFAESGCIKCHHKMEELGNHPKFVESAPKVFSGYKTIQKFGCFGCHEMHGFEGTKSIGPDLRLEPNYDEAAKQLLYDPLLRALEDENATTKSASGVSLATVETHARAIIQHPEESAADRAALTKLLKRDAAALKDAEVAILKKGLKSQALATAMHGLESQYLSADSLTLVGLLKDIKHPGNYRKVGPSLRHIEQKTTQHFIRYWTEDPKRFRPTTRMPQFFNLTNQQDEHGVKLTKIELAAIAQYLHDKSQAMELKSLDEGYQPDADRGKTAFEQRGCVACHVRTDVKGSSNDFGPDLSRISEKIKRDSDGFSKWLYTWLRDPQKHHTRSKMPNLFLEPVEKTKMVDGMKVSYSEDPAADITAFLLKGKSTYAVEKPADIDDGALDELTEMFLKKVLTEAQRGKPTDGASEKSFFGSRRYPIRNLKQIKGDEIELALGTRDGRPIRNHKQIKGDELDLGTRDGRPDDDEWRLVKLNYVGRKTISRYGCYGCHDIPGFEKSRPIGTTLQDWGRKDTSKLAPEHIEEFLNHHGEPDGSSTKKRAETAYKKAAADDFDDDEDRQSALAVTYFYRSLLHHGRPGFLWQKLRAPRSYDYEKTQTKGFDERLRMPKFQFSTDPREHERKIEAIATFVLGLVAEPPPSEYQYTPKGPALDRVEGERLLRKYNCTSCHMLELPKVTFWAEHKKAPFYIGEDPAKRNTRQPKDVLGADLLMQMRPPLPVDTKTTRIGKDEDDEDVTQSRISISGLRVFTPDENEAETGHVFHSWEHLDVDDLRIRPGPTAISILERDIAELHPGRGGPFAEWLFANLKGKIRRLGPKEANIARHQIPPVLWREGHKVQTPWLYQFLRNPTKLRHMAVLRMPRFNLSKQDAQTLANYFAAVEGVPYPYQQIPERTPEYALRMDKKMAEEMKALPDSPKPSEPHSDYLSQSWKLLNNKSLCLTCHSVGGLAAQQPEGQKDVVRGPDLELATQRLRPEWTRLWLSNPVWTTPYTQMPVNFDKLGQPKYKESFGGIAALQLTGVRDALMNYHRLLEQHKNTKFDYPPPPKAGAVKAKDPG